MHLAMKGSKIMNINLNVVGNILTVSLDGRLDTTTAPQLDNTVRTSLNGISKLIFDMEKLTYISSAGLRILLSAQKIMSARDGMKIKNCCAEVLEIFDITGFTDILDIE